MTNEHLQDALYRQTEARRQLEKAESADHHHMSFQAGISARESATQLRLAADAADRAAEAYELAARNKRDSAA